MSASVDAFTSGRYAFTPSAWAQIMRTAEAWRQAFASARVTATFEI